MAITVVANPASLTWANFRPSASKIVDPNDGTLIDALTRFDFNMPNLPHRMVDGQFAMADANVITITPNAQVFTGVLKTPALLSHEQLHYDVGIATARALARELYGVASSEPGGSNDCTSERRPASLQYACGLDTKALRSRYAAWHQRAVATDLEE
jgi:hypothetical protein